VFSTKLYELLRNKDLFDIFVAKQEYEGRRDRYGRFLYEFSNNKDVMKPVVSDYLINNGFLDVEWPENHRFAACLTHDVDSIYPSWKYTFFTAAKASRNTLSVAYNSDNELSAYRFKWCFLLKISYLGKPRNRLFIGKTAFSSFRL